MDQAFLIKNAISVQFPWFGMLRGVHQHTLWNNANFRLFLMSEGAGIFGNHFYQIALPWLVMEFTGSAGAMSTAIILSGISRVAMMMVGGTLSDRFSPRPLILMASVFRALLLAILTLCAATGQMTLMVLYGFSFISGITDAIFMPARGAVIPLLVDADRLKIAVSIASAQEKFWSLVGPSLAGIIITWLSRISQPAGSTSKSFLGPIVAFVIDIVAIAVSISILRPVKLPPRLLKPVIAGSVEGETPPQDGSIRDLLLLIWRQAGLRVSFLMVYAINTLSSGPLYIGVPMLAVSRFSEGAQALGFMSSALGCGALLGTLLAGLLPQPRPHHMGRLFLVVMVGLGIGLVVLFSVWSMGVDALAVLILSAMISYVNITGMVQIQKQTPPAFMGRMIGLLNLK